MNSISKREDFRDWIVDNWTTAAKDNIEKSITKYSKELLFNGNKFDISNVVDRNDLADEISDNLKTGLLNVVDTYDDTSNFDSLTQKIEDWATDKDLLHAENADKQFLKFIEEVFEFKTEYDILWHEVEKQGGIIKKDIKPLLLEMGDIFVTLIILCNQIGIEPVHCLNLAYEKIKGRTGKTVNGIFIKQEDIKSEV